MTAGGLTIDDEVAEFVRAISRLVKPENVKVACDVGSRDAIVARKLAEAFPQATVYAFECNPEALALCRRNIAGNKRVILVESAVSNIDGNVKFYPINKEKTVTPHADGNIGASSMFKANPDYPYETYSQDEIVVPSTRIDTWAKREKLSGIDVIWMDLQGAELLALEGMGGQLDQIKVVYTEVEYRQMYAGQPLAPAVRSFLSDKGFHAEARYGANEWFGNELFIRSSLYPWWKQLFRRI